MATAFYTEAYKKPAIPDLNVPAGVLLCQAVTWTAYTDTAVGDTIYLLRVPANAVLVDVIMNWSAGGGSATATLGTVTISTGSTVSATNVFASFSTVGAGTHNLAAGTQGTTNIATARGTVTVGTKFTVETGFIWTNGATKIPNDGTVSMAVLYYMDYGGDIATDASGGTYA